MVTKTPIGDFTGGWFAQIEAAGNPQYFIVVDLVGSCSYQLHHRTASLKTRTEIGPYKPFTGWGKGGGSATWLISDGEDGTTRDGTKAAELAMAQVYYGLEDELAQFFSRTFATKEEYDDLALTNIVGLVELVSVQFRRMDA